MIDLANSVADNLKLIVFVAAAAAVVARMFTLERGPLGIFADYRWLMHKISTLGWVGEEISSLGTCPYCLSVWLIAAAMIYAFDDVATIVVFAIIATAVCWVIFGLMRLKDIPDDNPRGIITRLINK